jgi:curved DNA-binding protein CbpA
MNHFHSAYSVLGLKPGSSRDKVVARYKRLARVWAPEKFLSAEEKADAEEELERIVDACTLLVDHFDSDEHNDEDCECLSNQNQAQAEQEEDEESNYVAKNSSAGRIPKRKRLSVEEERDRRFAARMEGSGGQRKRAAANVDEDEASLSKSRLNEKTFNFIIAGVAAVVLIVGWLSSIGSNPQANPAASQPQTLAPQMPQTAQGPNQQNQQMNPLQQLLRSSGEQAPQSTDEQAQPEQQSSTEQAQPQEAPQEQSQQSSE